MGQFRLHNIWLFVFPVSMNLTSNLSSLQNTLNQTSLGMVSNKSIANQSPISISIQFPKLGQVSGSYCNPPSLGMALIKNVLKNISGEITDGILLDGDAQKIKVITGGEITCAPQDTGI
jgi:hypothetical protein